MAGGSTGSGNNSTAQALQNFPLVPNSPGGAQAMAAGAAPTTHSVSQLQQILQKLGAQPSGGGMSPAMQLGNMGMGMAKMGQPPSMPQMAPQMRPAGAPAPFAAPQTPQMPGMMTGGMGMPGQGQMGLPWQALFR